MTSELPGFHRLGMDDRRALVAEPTGLSEEELDTPSAEGGRSDAMADRMVEHALGVMGLPATTR